MPKNIVVLSDGTGQDGGKGHDTNVYKLFRMLEDRTDKQVVFYDQGLGTGARQRLSGMAFGAGFDTNLMQGYRFIFDHYQAGDKIFLFGFSRGAATVRSLASFIHYFGILPASRPELIGQAHRIYMNRLASADREDPVEREPGLSGMFNRALRRWNRFWRYDLDDEEKGKSAEFVRLHPNQWATIEFLGVWDTVPALGLVATPGLDSLLNLVPKLNHNYHNFQLRRSVKHACHALAIDDERKWFWPTVWKETQEGSELRRKIDELKKQNATPEQIAQLEKQVEDDRAQKVEQVWFGGSHTDVGGGFWEAGFSDIALEWMVQKAFEHGLRMYFGSRKYWNFCVAPDATDDYHNPRTGLGKIYAAAKRTEVWNDAVAVFGPPRIHESVLERAGHYCHKPEKPGDPECYSPWILEKGIDVRKDDALLRQEYKRKYLFDSQDRYEKVGLETYRATGQKYPHTLAQWRNEPQNSFETWQKEYSFEDWKKEYIADLRDWFTAETSHLAGEKKFLVEKVRDVVHDPDGNALVFRKPGPDVSMTFRDYDKDTLPQIKKEVYETLKQRAQRLAAKPRWWNRSPKELQEEEKYRIARDRKRLEWYLKKLEAAQGQAEDSASSSEPFSRS